MTWWTWLLVFVVILAAGGWWIWTRIRITLRSLRALSDRIHAAEALAAHVTEGADRGAVPPSAPTLAVFTHPGDALRERIAVRDALREERRIRREALLPPWARR